MDVEKFQDIDGLVNLDFCEELNSKLEKLSNSLIEEKESSFKHTDKGLAEELDMISPKPFLADSDDEINASSTPKKKKLTIQSDSEDEKEEKPSVEECERDSASDFDIKEYGSQEELQKSLKECSQKSQLSSQGSVEPSTSSWVQCDRTDCQKWRRVDNVDDMVNLANGRWVCSMNNDDRRNNCELSQESLPDEEEDESVYTSYKPGTLVLGKMAGYPWWPGIVEDDPDFDSFFHLEHKKDKTIVSYHITFLDKEVSRAWLTDYAVRPFTGQEDIKDLGTMSFSGKNYGRSVTKAILEAKKAMELSSKKRIRKYGFLRRFNKKRKSGSKKDLTNDTKDEKTAEGSTHKNDKSDSSKKIPPKEEKQKPMKTKVKKENPSNPIKPTARQLKESKLEKKKRKLEKLEAEREKLKKLKSLKTAGEKPKNPPNNEQKPKSSDSNKESEGNKTDEPKTTEIKKKEPETKEISEKKPKITEITEQELKTTETKESISTEKEPCLSSKNNECTESENFVEGQGSSNGVRTETKIEVLDTELTESELYAEKMFNKYIDKDRLKALVDTPEQVEAKKQKAEEMKKLKEEKAEERRKLKELKAEERQKLKEAKKEERQKLKESKAEERQKCKESKKEERQNSKESKREDRQKLKESKKEDRQKSQQSKVEECQKSKESKKDELRKLEESKADERQTMKNEKKEDTTVKDEDQTVPDNIEENKKTESIKRSEKPGKDNEINSHETDQNEKKTKEVSEVKTSKAAMPKSIEKKSADKTKSKEKPTKEKRKEKPKAESKSAKTKEPKEKKAKVPKLIKPDLPNVNIDEIIENKTDKPVPNLVKPVFKVSKKKKTSSFQAPTKNKVAGGKRPLASPEAGDLEIDSEPPTKKINTELELNTEPPAKKPDIEMEVEEPLAEKQSDNNQGEVNIDTLLMDSDTTSKTTEILNDSPEF